MRQLEAHKMARSSTPGKKSCHATWKLDLHAPTTDNGTSTRLPPVPSPLQCLHEGTGGSEQLTLADNGLIYKTASNINTAVTAVQEQVEKVSHWCQETVQNQSKQGASPLVHTQQQSSKTSNASSILQRRSQNTPTNSDTSGSTSTECWRSRRRSNQQNSVARKDYPRRKPWLQMHQTTSFVPAVSEYDTQRRWLWCGSHNPVTV